MVEPRQPTRQFSRSIGLPAAGALHWDAPAPRALSCLSLLGWLSTPLADGVCMALSHMVAGACGVLVLQAIAGGHTPATCCAPPLPRQFGAGKHVVFTCAMVRQTLALFPKRSTTTAPVLC